MTTITAQAATSDYHAANSRIASRLNCGPVLNVQDERLMDFLLESVNSGPKGAKEVLRMLQQTRNEGIFISDALREVEELAIEVVKTSYADREVQLDTLRSESRQPKFCRRVIAQLNRRKAAIGLTAALESILETAKMTANKAGFKPRAVVR